MNLYSDYFVNEKSDETRLNIKLIDTMLYRRVVIKEECDGDLRELNKKLAFSYNGINYNSTNASVSVTVTKTFNYSAYPDLESATRDTYLVLMEKEQGDWKIRKVENFIDDIMAKQFENLNVDLNSEKSIDMYRSSIRENVRENFLKMNSLDTSNIEYAQRASRSVYNGSGAANYAYQYALNYNPKYADFSNYGGDCTNFISQCMYEGGGLSMVYGETYGYNCWFYISSDRRSATWTHAEYLYDYLFSNLSHINVTESNSLYVDYGDIIQLVSRNTNQAYHSIIISGIVYSSSGRSDLLVCAHTSNRRHVSLSMYYADDSSRYKRYINII